MRLDDPVEAARGARERPTVELVEQAEQAEQAAGSDRALEVVTAAELCRRPDPERAELLASVLVRGYRTILGGATGDGKTTLAFGLLSAFVQRREFLGWQGSGGRALVLDLEQGERSLKKQLREARLGEEDGIDIVRVPDGLALDRSAADIVAVEDLLASGLYDVFLLDPWYKAFAGDSNDERQVVDALRILDTWRTLYGFALLLPVHTRKPLPGLKFSINDLFGSSAFPRGAEVVLGLQLVGDGFSRLHFLKDRDGDLPVRQSWGLLFDREQGFRRDPKDGKKTVLDQVRDLLADDPTLTAEQLEQLIGCKDRAIRGALKKIRDEQAIADEAGATSLFESNIERSN